MEKLNNYDNSDLQTKIRHWLIKKIAGDHVIILNAGISILDRQKDGPIAHFRGISGCMCIGNCFNAVDAFGSPITYLIQSRKAMESERPALTDAI
jgi:hypothetical protein